ncbi:hypothetical protein Tco_0356191 [Tanacetum coccineum]
MINRLLSNSDHEHKNHEKLRTVIHTSANDQIDSNIIFDDLYMDNNSGQAEHDPNAHDQPYADIDSLIYNVQVEAESQRKMNIEMKKQKSVASKGTLDVVKQENIEKLKIKKRFKAFKVIENKYLDDIVTLEEKLKSHERVVFKMSHSLQTIHMLGTTPNLFYDPNKKAGLGCTNLERLKKAIEAQPKMYNGKNLKYHELKVNLPDFEETREDAEKSRLIMKDKMIPLDYLKLNKLYESFVPQKEVSAKRTYLSPSFTSNVSPASSSQNSNLPSKKMPNESQLLKLFINLDNKIKELGKLINIHHYMDRDKSFFYDNKADI